MPPKNQKGQKGSIKSHSAGASSSNCSISAQKSLLVSELSPIPSARSGMAPAVVAPFTLATWNVLADDHVYPHYYPQCTRDQLKWNARLPLLIDRIRQLNPDILCMQEVDNWKDWEPNLKERGYTSSYLARGGSKQDGCSISFKTDRFVQIDRFEVRMDDIADLPFKDPQRIRKHCVALGLVLRPADAPETSEGAHDICLVTTHIFWNPKFEDVKLRQAIYLMYQISQYWNNSDRLILCGDFNSTPDSALASYFRSGAIDLRDWPIKNIVGRGGYKGSCDSLSVFGIDDPSIKSKQIDPFDLTKPMDHEELFQLLKCPVMTHPYRLRSAYHNFLNFSSSSSSTASSSSTPSSSHASHFNGSNSSKGKKNPPQDANSAESGEPITSHFKEFSGTLDYILTSPGVNPVALLPLPNDKEMQEMGWLPNSVFASDHAILMAELQIGTRNR